MKKIRDRNFMVSRFDTKRQNRVDKEFTVAN